MPSNSRIVITSTDLSAALHRVQISCIQEVNSTQKTQDFTHLSPAVTPVPNSKPAGSSPSTEAALARWIPSRSLAATSQKAVERARSLRVGPKTRRFEVPFFSDGNAFSRFLVAKRLLSFEHAVIYADDDSPESHELARRVKILLESGLGAFVETQIGPIRDFDANGHLTILVTRLSDHQRSASGEEPVKGCVKRSDFLSPDNGFGGDIIYLDTQLADEEQLDAVLAHELTHAAVFSRCASSEVFEDGSSVPSWLNEAFAHCVERMVRPDSHNLQNRLDQFFQSPHCSPVVVPDELTEFALRRGPARAAACLFLESTLQRNGIESPGELLLESRPLDTLRELTSQSLPQAITRWSVDCCDEDTVGATQMQVGDCREVLLRGTAFTCVDSPDHASVIVVNAPAQSFVEINVLH